MIIMSEEEGVEHDRDYLKRVLPWAYDALGRIPRVKEAMDEFFEPPDVQWYGDDVVDLTNKVLFGLVQLEIEELREALEGLQGRRGWRLLLRTNGAIVYQCSSGEIANVPIELADVITSGRPFEGDVEAHGTLLRFSVGGDVLADLPRSLMLELRGSRPEVDRVERGRGGGREQTRTG